jgi:hypothetical protein
MQDLIHTFATTVTIAILGSLIWESIYKRSVVGCIKSLARVLACIQFKTELSLATIMGLFVRRKDSIRVFVFGDSNALRIFSPEYILALRFYGIYIESSCAFKYVSWDALLR